MYDPLPKSKDPAHRHYQHPTKPGHVTIPGHPSGDLHPKPWLSILRQAGLPEERG